MSDNPPETFPAPQEKKDIQEHVGRALSERRKLRKLSISDISQALKIRASFIEALESGEWSNLPGEVYVRGFAARYAQYLGLNSRELLAPYIDAATKEVPKSGEISPQRATDPVKSPWVWVGFGILFVAGLIRFLTPNAVKNSAPSPAVVPTPVEQKPVSMPQEPPRVALEKHRLDVFTPDQLWMRIKAADRTFEGFIPERTTWTFSGEGQFEVRLGYSQNVALIFDGKLVELAANQRKVLLPNAN